MSPEQKYRQSFARMGLMETYAAWRYVRTACESPDGKGEWLPDYRAALQRLGVERPPHHLIDEIKVMMSRYRRGDPNWRDGSKRR